MTDPIPSMPMRWVSISENVAPGHPKESSRITSLYKAISAENRDLQNAHSPALQIEDLSKRIDILDRINSETVLPERNTELHIFQLRIPNILSYILTCYDEAQLKKVQKEKQKLLENYVGQWVHTTVLVHLPGEARNQALVTLLEGKSPAIKKEILKSILKTGDGVLCKLCRTMILPDTRENRPADNQALFSSVERGKTEELRAVIAGDCNLDCQDISGYSALFTAVMKGRPDIVRELIASGAHTDLRSDDQFLETALMEAVTRFSRHDLGTRENLQYREIIDMLINAGANLNLQDHSGKTVLHIAVEKDQTEIVKVLIRAGADPSIKNANGETPLDSAIRNRFLYMVPELLSSHA